jgi:hypothetical protein
MTYLRMTFVGGVVTGVLFGATISAAVQLEPGDLVVASKRNASIVHIDPDTGVQSLITSGGLISSPESVVVDGRGAIFVGNREDIIEVDAATGAQSLLSDGMLGSVAHRGGLSIDPAGNLISVNSAESLLRINLETGIEQVLSIAGNLTAAFDTAVETDGQILVANADSPSAIYRIDPATGAQTPVWVAQPGVYAVSLSIESATTALVTDLAMGLLRVDLTNGTDSVVSSNPLTGGWGLAAGAASSIFYTTSVVPDTSQYSIVKVDVASGAVGIVSSGDNLDEPVDVAVVPPPSCSPTPASECFAGGKGIIRLKIGSDPSRDSLTWKFTKSTFTVGDLGAPDVDTSMAVCLYADGELVMSTLVGAAGTCDGRPCWKPFGARGFKYKNRNGNEAGITKATLKDGSGNATILFKGRGANLAPPLPLTFGSGVRVQLIRFDNPACWESDFTTFIKSDSGQFKARF